MRRRLHDGGHRQRGRLARRTSAAVQPVLDLRQQPRDASKATPTSPSPRMSRRASWPMAGTSCASATPTTSTLLEQAYQAFLNTADRPTLIVVHSHIGYGSPHKQDSPEAHGEPLGEDEVRLTKQFFGFDPDKSSSFPTGCANISPRSSARAARDCAAAWQDDVRALSRRVSRPCRADRLPSTRARCRRDGRQRCRSSRPSATGLSDARCIRQGAERAGRAHPLADRRRGRPGAQHQDAADLRRRRRLRGRRARSAITAAATCISACASTPCAPRSTA